MLQEYNLTTGASQVVGQVHHLFIPLSKPAGPACESECESECLGLSALGSTFTP
jgi:hypothetical protein